MDNFKMGVFRATALVAGNMIGSGVLLAPTLLAPYGSMALVGWILTTIGALALALVFCRLSTWIPNSGGPYTYVKHVFGNFIGLLMAWGYWISAWCGSASLTVGTLQYISIFAPDFAENTVCSVTFGLGMIWLFTYFNIKGLKETTLVGVIVFLIKILPIVLIAFVGIFFADFSQAFSFENCEWSSLGEMSTVLLWAFIGLESAVIPSDAVKNPRKTIPIATITGVLITAAIYIMGAIVITGVLPFDELIKSPAPYVDAARKIFGDFGYYFMVVTGICGLAGSLNGWILIQGQVPYSAAKEGLFPKLFMRTNKNGVPSGVVIGSILMTMLFVLSYKESLTEHLKILIDIAVLAMLFPYFFSVLAYGYMSMKKRKELTCYEKLFTPIVGLIALVYSSVAIVSTGEGVLSSCFPEKYDIITRVNLGEPMELKIFPDPILSRKCTDVELGDPRIVKVLDEMSKKLYEWNGAGLAAPQVGISKRLVVIDVRADPPRLYKMINPKIVWESEEMVDSKEGCLSLPAVWAVVPRHKKVRVEYYDENFEKRTLEAEGFLSSCVQHELDHLDGKVYIDRLSRLKRSRLITKFKKLQAGEEISEDE